MSRRGDKDGKGETYESKNMGNKLKIYAIRAESPTLLLWLLYVHVVHSGK